MIYYNGPAERNRTLYTLASTLHEYYALTSLYEYDTLASSLHE